MGAQAERALDGLRKLAGSQATITGSADEGWSIVGIGRSLPADLAPLFVLDASARLTSRYDNLSAFRMRSVKLDPATVSYEALAIHWWNRGAGKTALSTKEERGTVYAAIADLVNSKPGEPFLIVMSKSLVRFEPDGRASLPAELERLLRDPAKVSVATWGRHLSTNEYREVPNVVIVGSYDYDQSAYEAISLAADGAHTGAKSLEERRRVAGEEFTHNLYQAVCRGAARNQNSAVCGPANAYFIMNDHTGRRELVAKAFPGCVVKPWKPVQPKKKSKSDYVLEVLLTLLTTKRAITFKELRTACGKEDRSYIDKVKKQSGFQAVLRANAIRIVGSSFVRAIPDGIAASGA